MWGALGLVLALFTAQFAWRRSLRETVNFYASDVYGMSRSTHRRYALASLTFCLRVRRGRLVAAATDSAVACCLRPRRHILLLVVRSRFLR